ncbi:helix-turn-helix domain-containing protein [Salipiger abyssi]|uniref:helix-turn-helix domain-containing protein n=1 Tax=Salipiger abyssi TaxID=1250539 RepID=UPI001A8DDDE7|nr:XRE family transcriptional regulator [Salipiger abyssi]MBN9887220.1 helix-turn-helix transcriptional regulator [Salipiger abyssi]
MTGETKHETGRPSGKPEIGARLRARRRELKLTLQDVAERAGLSTGFISQAERDIAIPSLTSLNRICTVLGIAVQDVLPGSGPAPEATRRDARQTLKLKQESPQATAYERVSTTFPGSVLNGVIIREAPGYRSEPQSHEGEEIFFVLEGALTVELEGERIELAAGDSLHFSSHRLHSTWNHTDREAAVLHVCTMDVFGDRIAAAEDIPGTRAGHEAALLEAAEERK